MNNEEISGFFGVFITLVCLAVLPPEYQLTGGTVGIPDNVCLAIFASFALGAIAGIIVWAILNKFN